LDPSTLPPDWPHRSAGRRLRAGSVEWWVIDTGGPGQVILLLHGLGASGHSFARMIAGLAPQYRVIVPDLPGHGCSRALSSARSGPVTMAEDLSKLCAALQAQPAVVVGHSAGAVLALQLAQGWPEARVVGINAALGEFDGAAGVLFPVLAKGLAALPFAATGFARLWGRASTVDRLLDGTGSRIDAAGRAQYLRLVQDPTHVQGALAMMAQWDLRPVLARLPDLPNPVLLIAASGDRAVPCKLSRDWAARMPQARSLELPGGHLVHEESADGLARLIADWIAEGAA
jgi:magnesium chelatase accessory protein